MRWREQPIYMYQAHIDLLHDVDITLGEMPRPKDLVSRPKRLQYNTEN